jgi:tetratricopeptide (TPR) repeat protein
MYKKFVCYLGPLVFGLMLLHGCTSYMKGTIQLERENYEEAIESFQQELSQNPDNRRARERLGFAYLRTGQSDKAISEFNRVLEQKPGQSFATYYLGLAYLKKGLRGEAIETWQSYQNKQEPLVEQEIKKQLTLLEIAESIHLAKQALADEEKLGTLPPKSGTVAVFYFKDISPDSRYRRLQKAMVAMIVTDLSQVESLLVLERVRVQFLLAEMQLGQTGIMDENTAPRLGRLLGAENLIVGTLESGSMAVKTSVASTSKNDVVGAFAVTAKMEEFHKLQKEIVYNILHVLRVSFTPEEEKRFSEYHTKSLEAVIYFGQGLEALDAGNWKEAKNFFRKAVEEDPDFRLASHYRDSCPAAASPSISALSTMSPGEMANNAEPAVDVASNFQALADEEAETDAAASNPGQAPSAPVPATGSVSVSW